MSEIAVDRATLRRLLKVYFQLKSQDAAKIIALSRAQASHPEDSEQHNRALQAAHAFKSFCDAETKKQREGHQHLENALIGPLDKSDDDDFRLALSHQFPERPDSDE
jgi:hypothetical protein